MNPDLIADGQCYGLAVARIQLLPPDSDIEFKVSRVLHGSFESIPCEQDGYDIVWSQDAFLYSGNKEKLLQEVGRVLKVGGELIFTDPMQADDCPPDVLRPVYDRLSLQSLASFAFYKRHLAALGFNEVRCLAFTDQLRNHYFQVGEELKSRAPNLTKEISEEYIEKMLVGLDDWVKAADTGYLAWGVLYFKKLK